MAMIKLSSGTAFKNIPEGEYTLKIDSVKYDEAFGKLTIRFVTENGESHMETYRFIKSNGEQNLAALNSFSYIAKAAMNNFELSDLDPDTLVGHYIHAEIQHDVQQHRDDPSKTVTWVRMNNIRPSTGWAVAAAAADDMLSLLK